MTRPDLQSAVHDRFQAEAQYRWQWSQDSLDGSTQGLRLRLQLRNQWWEL